MKNLNKNLLLFTLNLLAFWLFTAGVPAAAADLRVCSTCPYKTVAGAVQAAKPNDRVLVGKGTYHESNIQVTKPLTLIGKGKPVLDARNSGGIFLVNANNVTIKGFEFRNTEVSFMIDHAAVKAYDCKHVTISENILINTYYGIYLQRTDSCTADRNLISGNSQGKTESNSGNAIHVYYANNSLITNNTVSGHRDGIYLEVAKNSLIKNNLSSRNIRYGLHFMFSDGNVYTHNTLRENGAGVAVMYTRNIRMEDNLFEHNWGPAAYGLLLKDISHSVIKNNRFIRNTAGIYMEGSSNLQINGNTFQGNGWALRLLANCSEDTFRLNNFMSNTFDVSTNASTSLNYFGHNYWDKYQGYDLNKDKIGDVPYRPVSLYSLVVERVPSSIMFLRSFIVDLMDKLEKVIPSFTPEHLIDQTPVLKQYAYDNHR